MEGYDIYKNGTKIASSTRTGLLTSFVLSSSEWGVGEWAITAKATRRNYSDSEPSNGIDWNVYSVTVDTGGYGTSSGTNLIG